MKSIFSNWIVAGWRRLHFKLMRADKLLIRDSQIYEKGFQKGLHACEGRFKDYYKQAWEAGYRACGDAINKEIDVMAKERNAKNI